MNVRALIGLLVLVLIPAMIFAGTTGKIKGKVVLKDSKEAAVGASVLVLGTSYGASTDANGEYAVLNVPAGTYTLRASYVGFHAPDVSNIKVTPDLTTEINFELIGQDIELPAISIVAERPLVNKSATNAVRILGMDDMKDIPVRGLAGVFALQPGVILQDNNIYIRGGREDEVGYYVEGASVRDVMNGRNGVQLIPEAIEEFQVQAGGYNAEYGGANAGIIRSELRSGLGNYKFSYQLETDKMNGDFSNSFLNTYSYGYTNNVFTVTGPIFQNNIKFFFAGEGQFQRDRTPSFWNGFEFPNVQFPQALVDGPGGGRPGDTLLAGNGIPSYNNSRYGAVGVQNGNIASNFQNRWTGNGTVTFDYNPLILRLGFAMNWQRAQLNQLPVQDLLDARRLPLNDNSSDMFNAKFTHFLNPKTFYEVNLNLYDSRRKQYDPDLVDNIQAYGDSIANAQYGYTYFNYQTGHASPLEARYYGFPFTRLGTLIVGGDQSTAVRYIKQKQSYLGGSADFTSQTGIHELKFGGSYQRYTVRQYSVTNLENLFQYFQSKPDSARDLTASENAMRSQSLPNNYGYDLFGNETDAGSDGAKHPKFIALYMQDKVEYKSLIINAGLRYDYFDNNDFEFIDPTNPTYVNNDQFHLDPTTFKEKPAFQAVSPRLGLAFPISDRTVFHMQYGKFIQSPRLDDIYIGSAILARNVSGRNFITNPVGFGLDPERTTQYEIGFNQQISDYASFDMTGFYKDILGQIQDHLIITQSGAFAHSYHALTNGDFATTKGFELTVTLRRIQRVQARLNYTLSDAEGTGSTVTSAISAVENGSQLPTIISPLTFNQTHRGSFNIDYRFQKGDGGPILERFGANMLFSFNSGHNFTLVTGGLGQTGPADGGILFDLDPRNRRPLEPVNSSSTPWNFSVDIKLDKTVSIANLFDMNIYLYIQNMFDSKNVINVYGRTGNAEDDGFLTNPDLSNQIVNAAGRGDPYVAMYQAINLGLRQHYWRNQGGDLLGTPRQIRFGFRIEY